MINNSVLKHQVQPCAASCFSTCMAMIIGVDVNVVKAELHEEYREHDLSLGMALKNYDIKFASFDSADRNNFGTLNQVGVYFVGIPSLNIEHGMHYILIEVMPDDEWAVYDPVMGIEGKRYYTASLKVRDDSEGAAVFLTGNYNLEAFISAVEVSRIQALANGSVEPLKSVVNGKF